jgi:hypothetical protein
MTDAPTDMFTRTYTCTDQWGREYTYYADGTYMGASGGGLCSHIGVIRLELNMEGFSMEKLSELAQPDVAEAHASVPALVQDVAYDCDDLYT